MAQVDDFRAMLDELVCEFDRRWHLELERVGEGLLRWLDGVLARMPCDTWQDEFNRLVANLARDQVFIEEESQKAFIAWINDANEAAKRDAQKAAAMHFDGDARPADEGPSADGPVLRPLPEGHLLPQVQVLLREALAAIEKLSPDQWLEEVRKLLDHLDLPPKIKAQILEYYTALDKRWRETWGLLHQRGPIDPEPAQRETNQELLLRVAAGLDKLIAEGRLDELIDAMRELVRRIPELTPPGMLIGDFGKLVGELQDILNQFLDLLEALPPDAGEVAIELLQLALDIAGMFPGPTDLFDLIGALVSARRGEWLSVLISVLAAAPLAGIIAGIGKISKRLAKLRALVAKLKGPAREILIGFIAALMVAIKEIPLNSVQAAVAGLKRFVEKLRKLLGEAIARLKKQKPPAARKVPNPDGRKGGPAHQADVAANNAQGTGVLKPKKVGNRVPDGVGKEGQAVTIRGKRIDPGPNGRVILESENVTKKGIPVSKGRDQIRDIRAADPNATIVVTDSNNVNAAPIVYPPGTQPPPRGRLPPNTPSHVPYP